MAAGDEGGCDNEREEQLRRHVWGRREACVHKLKVSALYHLKRARWFEILDRSTTAFAIIGSTGAVLAIVKGMDGAKVGSRYELYLSVAVAVVSTIGLVFAYSQRARQHTELARDFRKLLAEVERTGEYPTAEQIDRFNADAIVLDSQEPNPMTVVQIECENQLAIASGGKPIVTLPFYQRLLKHVWDFAPPEDPRAQPQSS